MRLKELDSGNLNEVPRELEGTSVAAAASKKLVSPRQAHWRGPGIPGLAAMVPQPGHAQCHW